MTMNKKVPPSNPLGHRNLTGLQKHLFYKYICGIFIGLIYIQMCMSSNNLYQHLDTGEHSLPMAVCLCGLVVVVLDYRSLPLVVESWRGHIRRLFHLWPRFITFGGWLAHLAHHVHKSGLKTSIIIIILAYGHLFQQVGGMNPSCCTR